MKRKPTLKVWATIERPDYQQSQLVEAIDAFPASVHLYEYNSGKDLGRLSDQPHTVQFLIDYKGKEFTINYDDNKRTWTNE